MKYNVLVRQLIHDATKIPLDLIFRAYQNDGRSSPPADIDWAAYYLTNVTADQNIYSVNTNFRLNYQLEYLISIYGKNNFDNVQRLKEYFGYNKAADFLHTNKLGYVTFTVINNFVETINELYYQRFDCRLILNAQELRENPGYLDKVNILTIDVKG